MTLIRIIMKMVFQVWMLVYYPLSIVWKYAFSIVLIGIIAYVFISLFSGDPNDTYRAPGDGPAPVASSGGVLIQPIERVEDGNSAFASDLLLLMNDQEKLHYSQLFYWVMTNQKAGEAYQWRHVNMYGTLTPHASFKNKLNVYCRRFDETLKVKDTEQTLSGIACEKGGGSWCKLRNNSTPACNLGRKGGFGSWWSDTKRSIGRWF